MIIKFRTLFYIVRSNQANQFLPGPLLFRSIPMYLVNNKIRLILSVLLVIAFENKIYSQIKNCNCREILTPSFSSYNNHEKAGIHFLNLIDSALYYKIKRDYYEGVNIMGIHFDKEYQTFNQLRNSKLEKLKYYSSREASEYTLMTFAHDTIACQWLECNRIAAENRHNLFVWPEKVTPETISVQIFFNPPPGVERGKITEDRVYGATIDRTFPMEQIIRRGVVTKVFKRANDETEFSLYINAGGYTAHVYLPAAKKVKSTHAVGKNKHINPGDPIFIKSNQPGDFYLRLENNKVIAGGLDQATTFRIEKYKKDDNDHVSSEGRYFIRGNNWNSYLQGNEKEVVVGEKASKKSILIIKKSGSSKDIKIAENDEIHIRGISNLPNYFKSTVEGNIVPSALDSASTFVFIKSK